MVRHHLIGGQSAYLSHVVVIKGPGIDSKCPLVGTSVRGRRLLRRPRCKNPQNRYPNPTEGSARWVILSAPFKTDRSYVGELYTKPRYSARTNTCRPISKSAPPP